MAGPGSAPTGSIKTRVAAGERLLGVLLRMPNDELLEMAAVSGFDFVVVDCEHGPADVSALRQHIVLAETRGVEVLVRIGGGEPALALRALDQGASGIIAPHIDDAAQAKDLVDAVHYPPLGQRGFATYSRAGHFGLVEPRGHQQHYRDHTLVIGMIESPLAVTNAAEIVAVPGLDGIMIGTADLAASSSDADPDPKQSFAAVNQVLASTGSYRMDIVGDIDRARAAFDEGAQLVVYNLTHTVMQHLSELRRAR